MVIGLRRARLVTIIGASLLVLFAGTASAAVVASIDRERIESNESFTLEITVDGEAAVPPDLSVLDDDFEIGQTSRLSEARIINGQVTRSMSWTIGLAPKRAGVLTIPPITVGSEQSNALSITVTEPELEPPGEADVFITAEAEFDETYVQAQVIYTIKIYRAVATRQPALREPEFSGAEVLVEVASDERSYEAILNNRAYNVVERAFAVFPQESGEILISPARFEARVLKDGRITGRKVFSSEPRTIKVNPIPPPPADFPNAAWLPAKEVTLADEWSREPDRLRAGEPISRDITVSALGQLETQIPVIDPPVVAGLNVYPDKPALTRRLETGGIRGVRTDQYAIIGVSDGDVILPKLELPWWDIEAGEWRVASVPQRTLTISPAPGASLPPPEAETPVADPEPTAEADVTPAPAQVVYSDFWRLIAQLLAVVWIATALAWWWSSRPRREQREPPPVPVHKQQARYLKAARKAALEQDAHGVRAALLGWAELQWPENTPRSVGALASRVSAPLADELVRLSRASYGSGDVRWDGNAMAQAIRSFAVLEEAGDRTGDELLPPLMPS